MFTLEALLELSRTIDGAVLIFTGPDKAWYRDAEVRLPRDNVVFEYALFLSTVGRERAVVVCR